MRLVILESPFSGDVTRNTKYARACVRDSLSRGEAPLASHLLYTQPGILDDQNMDEQLRGVNAGLAWLAGADATVVYTDLGVTGGMMHGIKCAEEHMVPVETRTLPGWEG